MRSACNPPASTPQSTLPCATLGCGYNRLVAHGKRVKRLVKQGTTLKQAAEIIGVTPKWIRRQIKAGIISPERVGNKRNGTFVLSQADVQTLQGFAGSNTGLDERTALARITQLESDRSDLLVQVAWARAIAQEQQKALETEQSRSEKLQAELETQRERIEQLKALSAFDRLLGRHKAI